jgi:predicted PurR-regulated permease PerM
MFGVKYAILWAVIAFLLNYIPNVGSLIAAIPAVIFSGVQLGSSYLLWTGLMYLGVNFLIGSIIEPKLMGKGMGLSTAIIFISLMFWGWLFGPIGMFLSVPLTMVLKVLLLSNDDSRYFAILIGTREEAEILVKKNKKINSNQK